MELLGKVFRHKLSITEENPSGCRPLLQFPWHASERPSFPDNETQNPMGIDGNSSEDIERVHEVWCRYSEKIKQNSKVIENFMVKVLIFMFILERLPGSTSSRTNVPKII